MNRKLISLNNKVKNWYEYIHRSAISRVLGMGTSSFLGTREMNYLFDACKNSALLSGCPDDDKNKLLANIIKSVDDFAAKHKSDTPSTFLSRLYDAREVVFNSLHKYFKDRSKDFTLLYLGFNYKDLADMVMLKYSALQSLKGVKDSKVLKDIYAHVLSVRYFSAQHHFQPEKLRDIYDFSLMETMISRYNIAIKNELKRSVTGVLKKKPEEVIANLEFMIKLAMKSKHSNPNLLDTVFNDAYDWLFIAGSKGLIKAEKQASVLTDIIILYNRKNVKVSLSDQQRNYLISLSKHYENKHSRELEELKTSPWGHEVFRGDNTNLFSYEKKANHIDLFLQNN